MKLIFKFAILIIIIWINYYCSNKKQISKVNYLRVLFVVLFYVNGKQEISARSSKHNLRLERMKQDTFKKLVIYNLMLQIAFALSRVSSLFELQQIPLNISKKCKLTARA